MMAKMIMAESDAATVSTSVVRTTVAREGFYGMFHEAKHPFDARKAVIVLGGSEGNENVPMNVGAKFAAAGISALGVCYWNVPGLPDELVEVPLDPFEQAVAWLQARGFERIAVYGISKGGELALLLASLMPGITGVIAVSPLDYVMCGIAGNGSLANRSISAKSGWAWHGHPVEPCVPQFKFNKLGALWRLIAERQLDTCGDYVKALQSAPEESRIAVENINGPILLLHAANDSMWPSGAACRRIEQRCRDKNFPHKVTRVEYQYASHILVPLEAPLLRLFAVERRFPDACRASRQDAFSRSVAFLRQW